MTLQAPFSVPVIEPMSDNEGPIHRSVAQPYSLVDRPSNDVRTLFELMQHAGKKHADQQTFEEKEVERNGKKEMKKWTYMHLGPFEWQTYKQVAERSVVMGAGLRARCQLQAGDRLLIFNSTSADWMLVAHGCFSQSATIATAYDTLGVEGLVHALNETESQILFAHASLLPVVAKLGDSTPGLRYVIYNGDKTSNLPEIPNVQVIHLSEVEEAGNAGINEYPPVPPKPEDIACIMYTSGSTGNPKGVMIKHSNLIALVMGGIGLLIETFVSLEDVILAYLPLAHVLEFVVEHICVFWGVQIGYGSPRTLTDTSVRNSSSHHYDGVPAVWDTIRKAVLTKLHSASKLVQNIFHAAFQLKWTLMQAGLPTGFLDPVFRQIREQTGGRLRFALSGGAAISAASQQFLSVTVCPILQGYGMTESCGMCSILSPEMFQLKSSGAPVPCVEVKLVDVPEAGYYANADVPQGEVWVRGPAVVNGYYKNPTVTAETFTEDGWLMTGDVGQWNSDGTLSIIDRKKNLVKLSHGEYIALEKIESVYKTAHVVANICVYADSSRSRAVALVHPPEKEIQRIGSELGLSGGVGDLCEEPAVRKRALEEILAEAKAQGLRGAELIGDVYLCEEEWTAQNGLLTAAQKLKRNDIYRHFKSNIDAMYANE
ncbi:hypothetical protein BDF22DRAFT_698376 [Syncephalis plumigaleata]|nr:hypothetical protein BDF22DRAFT_698376 [Syncephalis plumigaleata]